MIHLTRRAALALGAALLAAPAFAHSTAELAELLAGKEKYFKAFDKEAPAFALSDAEGKVHSPEDFRGKVVALNFVCSNCAGLQPLHAEKLAEVQGMINQTPMKDLVEFVTITTGPLSDTQEVTRGYGTAHGLDPVNWTVLTKRPDQPESEMRDLAEAFGRGSSETEDGAQIHGAVTHVIDMTGRWRASFEDPEFGPTNMVLFLNALTNDSAEPHGHAESGLWDRMMGVFN